MDTAGAIEKVREKLEASFGKAMTMMIVASASNTCGATIGLNEAQYGQFIDCVCRDQRVVDMWGARGAADALAQWKALV